MWETSACARDVPSQYLAVNHLFFYRILRRLRKMCVVGGDSILSLYIRKVSFAKVLCANLL